MLASDFINANFVGYNNEAAVSNLFEVYFCFSKPCFYCTNHSLAKIPMPSVLSYLFTFHVLFDTVS